MPEPSKPQVEHDIAVHIFTASAALVGVCLTVLGLFRISDKLRNVGGVGNELVAVDAVFFLGSCIVSYLELVSQPRANRVAGRLPPQPLVGPWAGPICVAAPRSSSLAYSSSSTPRSARLARLAAGPSAAAGGCETNS